MLVAIDFGPLGVLAIIFAGVVISLVIKAAREQDKKRGNLRPSTRPVQMARHQPRVLHQPQAGPAEDVDSDEAEEVAEQLAPEFVEVSRASTLVKPEETAAQAKSWLNFRDANEVRRAFILKEVLGKPKALSRR